MTDTLFGWWRTVSDALSGVEFAAWWWLLGLPLLVWIARRTQKRPHPALRFPHHGVFAGAPRGKRWVATWIPRLRWMALALLILALAQPRTGVRRVPIAGDGIDITLVMDISSSMLAEDFQPLNRMAVAKQKAKAFVQGRASDRIGVIAFAGEALTQVPLTVDYPVVLAAIDYLQPGQLEDGTAIGTAIATAANRLRSGEQRTRVMLLLTDGENNRGAIDPRTAAQAASAVGVRIYTIGVGSDGMAPTPVGRGLFGLRYENRPVRIDEPLLQDIADETGGRYFRARDAEALGNIFAQIDRLEKTRIVGERVARYTDRYPWPLALAMALLLMEFGVRAWRGPLT